MQLSVIIPIYNDSAAIKSMLPQLRSSLSKAQIIVVDGGSEDGGPEWLLKQAGVELIRSAQAGRAFQMNVGAREASGSALLFLHADTTLSPGACADLESVLHNDEVKAGAFRFRLDGQGRFYRAVDWMVKQRVKFLRMPYGDQGLFIRRSLFESLQGFPELPLLEDLALVDAIKQQTTLYSFPGAAITSARKWEEYGKYKVMFTNFITILAFRLGFSPLKLQKFRNNCFK